tara:strand:+ start:742 stop:2991 length:2250 start_codon:yes stop_codon:yes gene_type:complete
MATKEIDGEVQHYLSHIAAYDREFSKWETRVSKILKRYRDDTRTSQDTGSRFNILWSNVQTLKAATFARLPKPDVSRRFRDNDQVGRVASLILERALDYEITHYSDYRDSLTACIYDRFLGGRGVSWVRYDPKFKPGEAGEIQITEDAENEGEEAEEQETGEVIDYECAPTDYVHWRDFGHNVARTWEETTMVWRKVYMTRPMVEERFGEKLAKKIPLDAQPEEMKNASKEGVDKRALVYEIWDRETNKALWVSKSMGEFLDEKDDPLELEGFYPCPKPLFSTITNDSLVPVPDYALYQDQANALDTLSDRIDGLVKALQVKGVYDASTPELARLFSEATNNDLIPVKNWNAFAEKKGLQGAIDLVDIAPIAAALIQAYQAFEQVKNQVYDITGISDIVRGQSVASETATAQQIKGQYASLRLKAYQDDVNRFATHLIQLKAQIICQHFDPKTILMISAADQLNEADKQMIPQALELLKNEPLRSFRIEISTDSMIQMDESQEKQDRIEFLSAVGQFLEKAVQATQVAPQVVPLALDMLKFGVTAFKVGKSIEGQIDQTAEKFKEELQQKAQQPPQPSPEQMQMQAEQQMAQAKMQIEQQSEQGRQQGEMQRFQMQQQMEQQTKQAEMQQEMALENMRAQLEMEKEARAQDAADRNEAMQRQAMVEAEHVKAASAERLKLIEVAGQIEIARMGAESAPDAAQAGEESNVIMQKLVETQTELLAHMAQPKNSSIRIAKQPDGSFVGERVG